LSALSASALGVGAFFMPNPNQTMTHKTEPQALQAVLWSREIPARLLANPDHDERRDLPWLRVAVMPVRSWERWTINERIPRSSSLRRTSDGRMVQWTVVAEPAFAPCTCETRVWPTDSAEWEDE